MGMQRGQPQVPHHRLERRRLIVGTDGRKFRADLRRRAVPRGRRYSRCRGHGNAGIHAKAGPDELRPPSPARAQDDAMRRNAAENRDHRRVFRTLDSIGHPGIRQPIAVMQQQRLRQSQDIVDLQDGFVGHVSLVAGRGLHNPCSAGARSPLQQQNKPRNRPPIYRIRGDPPPQELAPFPKILEILRVVAPASKGLSLSRSR